jgi:hypothetical protein
MGASYTQLARSMDYMAAWVAASKIVEEAPSAIGRRVVDKEKIDLRQYGPDRPIDWDDVIGLVIRGKKDQGFSGERRHGLALR